MTTTIETTAFCKFPGELELVYRFVFFLATKDTILPQNAKLSGRGEASAEVAYNFMVQHLERSILKSWSYPYGFACNKMTNEGIILINTYSFEPQTKSVKVGHMLQQLPMSEPANAIIERQKTLISTSTIEKEMENMLIEFKIMFERMFLPNGKQMLEIFEDYCLQFES